MSEKLISRRQFLTFGSAAAVCAVTPKAALSLLPTPKPWGAKRFLKLHNIHTGDTFESAYFQGGDYIPSALQKLNTLLRDRRDGQEATMNPELFDLLHKLTVELGSDKPFEIVCGHRSQATNDKLRRTNKGVARHSRHITGNAIDLYLPGIKLADLKNAARSLKMGGVGYYPTSHFVHVDIRPQPAYWS